MPKAIPDDTHENKRRKDSKFKKFKILVLKAILFLHV
jgi:hypothetical protein